MEYIFLISGGILVFIAILFFFKGYKRRRVNFQQEQQQIKKFENQIKNLKNQYSAREEQLQTIVNGIKFKQNQINYKNQLIKEKQNDYNKLLNKINDLQQKVDKQYNQQKEIINQRLRDFKEITSQAADNYFTNLQIAYDTAAAAHTQKMTRLQEEYTEAAASLNNLKATRKAAYEAILKQKQIKQNKQNYCLIPSSIDLDDIYTLEKMKKDLHKPRILSMLIWQTYWQPIAKKQFPIILQDKTKTGIYKITNLQTDQCYIGQAVDIYKRWSEHCKAGLGIDTPVGNKLYKAIQEYGLQNFAFEVLMQCSQEELNEKEKYFIELYQSDLYGYNSQAGNKK